MVLYKNEYSICKRDYIKLVNGSSSKQVLYGGRFKKRGTYADNDYIYSVDMMFMYLDAFHPKPTSFNVQKLKDELDVNYWRDDQGTFSPNDVLNDKHRYKDHYDRVLQADLSYPIIIHQPSQIVVDGVHRLTKAYIEKRKKIKAYVFNDELMKKFIISKRSGEAWRDSDWNYYESLSLEDIRKMFEERFD